MEVQQLTQEQQNLRTKVKQLETARTRAEDQVKGRTTRLILEHLLHQSPRLNVLVFLPAGGAGGCCAPSGAGAARAACAGAAAAGRWRRQAAVGAVAVAAAAGAEEMSAAGGGAETSGSAELLPDQHKAGDLGRLATC